MIPLWNSLSENVYFYLNLLVFRLYDKNKVNQKLLICAHIIPSHNYLVTQVLIFMYCVPVKWEHIIWFGDQSNDHDYTKA